LFKNTAIMIIWDLTCSDSPHEEKCVPQSIWVTCSSPKGRYRVSRATPWQEAYLVQTHFCKMKTTRNHPHQNALVTRTQVKTLHKPQTSHI
jgi:hypothetical protein